MLEKGPKRDQFFEKVPFRDHFPEKGPSCQHCYDGAIQQMAVALGSRKISQRDRS